MDHKQSGNEFYNQSRWEEAKACYSEALQADPQMTAALSNRAACSIQLQRWGEALDDCNAALATATGNLRIKVLWRKAICLRNLGGSQLEWESTVSDGLKLDPENSKLKDEKTYVFVRNVDSAPRIYTERGASRGIDPHAASNGTKSDRSTNSTNSLGSASDLLPPLPLTYNGLLKLIRMHTPEAYEFWYAKVDGPALKAALRVAGVEPDTLDYFCKLMISHPESPKNREFMAALKESPRFETARFMADEGLYNAASQLLN